MTIFAHIDHRDDIPRVIAHMQAAGAGHRVPLLQAVYHGRLAHLELQRTTSSSMWWNKPLDRRVIPSNVQAEQVLLGAVLLDNAKLTQVTHLLSAVRFADPIHGVIYSSICKAVDAGQTANVALLLAEFEGTGALDEVGGTTYLGKLVDQGNLQKVDARFYAESIHDAWLRRELITAGERLHALAEDVIQGAYGESVSDFGEASGVDQAGYVASRLRGLLSSVEAAMGTPA